jgi:hypothetical protein
MWMFASVEEGYPAPWNPDTFFAAALQMGTDSRSLELARLVIALAKERGFGPIWLRSPQPVFAVGTPQYFKVTGNGRIGFPFSRLEAGSLFPQLALRLSEVLPSLGVIPEDVNSKGKGGQLAALFQTDDQLHRFFDVWTWFHKAAVPNPRLEQTGA